MIPLSRPVQFDHHVPILNTPRLPGSAIVYLKAIPNPLAECPLTAEELELISFLIDGATCREIAERKKVAWASVKVWYSRLYRKIDARNQANAVYICLLRGWVK